MNKGICQLPQCLKCHWFLLMIQVFLNYQNDGIYIHVLGRRIVIKMPKDQVDTNFMLTLRYAKWDPRGFCCLVPNFANNIENIKSYFGNRITLFEIQDQISIGNIPNRTISKNEVLAIKTVAGRVKIIFGFH